MKKTKQQKTEELPITIELKLAGQDKTIKTDNILSSLREMDIDITKVKSRAVFEITHAGETYRKVMTIIQFKRLVASDIIKQIIAKQFTQAVGLTFN